MKEETKRNLEELRGLWIQSNDEEELKRIADKVRKILMQEDVDFLTHWIFMCGKWSE